MTPQTEVVNLIWYGKCNVATFGNSCVTGDDDVESGAACGIVI